MESSDVKTGTSPQSTSSSSSHHLPHSSSPSTAAAAVVSPCAACKLLRRRCADKCILAPYFPPTQPHKFAIAHRVFGASNITKILQELPEPQRADAVASMVYEASARVQEPVYGCAGAIWQLQKQVEELQAELAKTQAQIATMQTQQADLVAPLISMQMAESGEQRQQQIQLRQALLFHRQPSQVDTSCFLDDNSLGSSWEPLWA